MGNALAAFGVRIRILPSVKVLRCLAPRLQGSDVLKPPCLNIYAPEGLHAVVGWAHEWRDKCSRFLNTRETGIPCGANVCLCCSGGWVWAKTEMDFGHVPIVLLSELPKVTRGLWESMGLGPASAHWTGIAWLPREAAWLLQETLELRGLLRVKLDFGHRTLACLPAFPRFISLFSLNFPNKCSRAEQPLSLHIPWVQRGLSRDSVVGKSSSPICASLVTQTPRAVLPQDLWGLVKKSSTST